jgi:hypothetical protein
MCPADPRAGKPDASIARNSGVSAIERLEGVAESRKLSAPVSATGVIDVEYRKHGDATAKSSPSSATTSNSR